MKKTTSIILTTALLLSAATLSACSGRNGSELNVSEQNGSNIINVTYEAMPDGGTGIAKDGNNESGSTTVNDSSSKDIKEEVDALLSDSALKPAELLKFVRENINALSKEDAGRLLLHLEKLQNSGISAMTDRYDAESFQNELLSLLDLKTGVLEEDEIKDTKLIDLLAEARDNGYRTETAEGSFFPVIDYSVYLEFTKNLPEDLKAYFTIMAVESGKAPAKDAELVIGWDEVIARALEQQKFLSSYGQAQKAEDIKPLYSKYVSFIFNGLPNTPGFDQKTGVMSPDLRESLKEAAENGGDTRLEKALKDYAVLLEKNKYKLTDEVAKFREKAIAELSV